MVTADLKLKDACSLKKKAMTHLDNILKSRDVTLWTKGHILCSVQFSHYFMPDSVTPWDAARQASLSITNSQSLLKLLSFESVMPSNHLILCRPNLLLPSIASGSFQMSQFFASGGQSTGGSPSASVLPMNIQD